MTETKWKKLCAELVDIATAHCNPDDFAVSDCAAVLARARTALAQPEPEGVTLDCDEIDVPVWHRGDDFHVYKEGYAAGWAEGVSAAAAAHYARPTIEPVPVAERLPGPEDCDAEDMCYWWVVDATGGRRPCWIYCRLEDLDWADFTHWARWDALPVPGAEVG